MLKGVAALTPVVRATGVNAHIPGGLNTLQPHFKNIEGNVPSLHSDILSSGWESQPLIIKGWVVSSP